MNEVTTRSRRTGTVTLVVALVLVAGWAGYFIAEFSVGRPAASGQDTASPRTKAPSIRPAPRVRRMRLAGDGIGTVPRESVGVPADGPSSPGTPRLASLPYVTARHARKKETGVVSRFDRARAADGVNLYSSAHAPEAYLMDMEGTVRHTWRKPRDEVWPERAGEDLTAPRRYFRRVRVLPNGDLLAVYDYAGIVRLDADSRVVWAYWGWNHHAIDVTADGRVFVLGRDQSDTARSPNDPEYEKAPRRRLHGRWILDENVTILDQQGHLREIISLIDCIQGSRFASLLDRARWLGSRPEPIDLVHSNSVQVVDAETARRTGPFALGNLLVSFRDISTIAVIDPSKRQVVWAQSGMWRRQHHPVLLPSGTILLFDNFKTFSPLAPGGALTDRLDEHEGTSACIEFVPESQEIRWEYRGEADRPLFSALMGANQRLWNGNTLITESDYGRAMEITPDKRIVWEFNTPHTVGEDGKLIAVVPEVRRLRRSYFEPAFRRSLGKGPPDARTGATDGK